MAFADPCDDARGHVAMLAAHLASSLLEDLCEFLARDAGFAFTEQHVADVLHDARESLEHTEPDHEQDRLILAAA